jgi:hypothetical protein
VVAPLSSDEDHPHFDYICEHHHMISLDK